MKAIRKPLAEHTDRKGPPSGVAVALRLRHAVAGWTGRHPAMRQSARLAA
jgi:hypothetical protein